MMKHSSLGVPAFAILVLLLLQFLPASKAAIKCSDVVKDLAPCVKYLTSGGSGSPSSACCSGVSSLASAASTSADRKTACGCIQSAAKSINPSVAAATALPGSCGISLPFTVSPTLDCSKIT